MGIGGGDGVRVHAHTAEGRRLARQLVHHPLGAEAQMLIGDAYAELENPNEAVQYYEKAAKSGNNLIVSPTALWKAGMMYLQLNNKDAAIKAFQQIKDNYPESPEWNEVDKYISYAENR